MQVTLSNALSITGVYVGDTNVDRPLITIVETDDPSETSTYRLNAYVQWHCTAEQMRDLASRLIAAAEVADAKARAINTPPPAEPESDGLGIGDTLARYARDGGI